MYSSLKYFRVDKTGFGADLPSPQRELSFTTSANSSRVSKSSIVPLPSTILFKIASIFFVPSRQGVHFPQLSCWVKFIKKRATSTIHVSSFITTSPPEPTIAPSFFNIS